MRKNYEGFCLPSPVVVRYSIDWRCKACGCEDVVLDPEDNRELSWCDGAPCTEDQLRRWICQCCGAVAIGRNMNQTESGFEVLYRLDDGPD